MTDVSVIIAAYNVEAYIERAIRSALEQQKVSVEVIVINDGSTDRTAEIVNSISDPRIKYIALQQNTGPSAARNAGIASACGTWISILDGDDMFSPERLYRCLLRAKGVKADIVVDNIEAHNETTAKRYPLYEPNKFARLGVIDLAKYIKGNVFFMRDSALGYLKPIFSTSFLIKHNLTYDPAIRIGEDYGLMSEALANGALCVVEPSLGYIYTVRKNSMSHRLTLDDVERIKVGNTKFKSRYTLTAAAAKAQEYREDSVKEAYAFIKLVDAIKQRDIRAAYATFISCPPAARHLWHVVKTRTMRLFKQPSPI